MPCRNYRFPFSTPHRFVATGIVFAACLVFSHNMLDATETAKYRVLTGEKSVLIEKVDSDSRGEQNKPVLRYQSTANPRKPYVQELFTPSGVNVLRDSPHDHVHHHALMFALAVDGVDFWSEGAACGSQRPHDVSAGTRTHEGVTWAGLRQELDWIGPKGKKMLAEQRLLGISAVDGNRATLATWHTRLATPDGSDSVTLSGDHYFGLGLRFVESMDRVGRHFNADGKKGLLVRGDERVTPTRWSAYTAPIDGKPVTVAMFDHPANPRHPAHFFTMLNHFSYIAATMNVWKQPLVVEAGEPLRLTYGVAVWDGEVRADEVEKLYRVWVRRTTR